MAWMFRRRKKPEQQAALSPELSTPREPLWTKNFSLIWLINLAVMSWSFMLNASFPIYILDLGGTEMLVGITVAAVGVAALTTRPLTGWMMDNSSRSSMLRVGIVLLLTISAILFFVPILLVAVIARILGGFMFAAATTSTHTNAADSIPKSRFGEGIGILGTANTIANALAPALGLALIAGRGSRALFAACTALILFAIFMERGLKYKTIEKDTSNPRRKKIDIRKLFDKEAVPASLLLFFSAVPFGGVIAFIAIFGELYELGSGGWFFAINAAGTGSTRVFSGRIVDLRGEKPMIILGNICVVLALLLLLFDSSAAFYLSGLFFGFGFGLLIPALQAMSMRIAPLEKRGAATGTFLCGFDLSISIGGLSAGFLVTMLGYRPMFTSLAIFPIISFLLYFLWASKSPSAFKYATKK